MVFPGGSWLLPTQLSFTINESPFNQCIPSQFRPSGSQQCMTRVESMTPRLSADNLRTELDNFKAQSKKAKATKHGPTGSPKPSSVSEIPNTFGKASALLYRRKILIVVCMFKILESLQVLQTHQRPLQWYNLGFQPLQARRSGHVLLCTTQ